MTLPRPTPRLAGIAAFGLVPAALPVLAGQGAWALWVAFVAALALATVIDLARLPLRESVAATADAPDEMAAGHVAEVTVRVTVAARRDLRLLLAVDLSDDHLPWLPFAGHVRGGKAGAVFTLAPRVRGTIVIERAWVRLTAPWGLVSVTRIVPIGRLVRVFIPAARLGRGAFRYDEGPQGRIGTKVERFDGDGSEFDALREFRAGDDHRSMDWKASARHRSLLRRQFRAERDHHVVLALDTGRLMATRIDGVPKLDHAVAAALRLAAVALKTGDRVGLYGFDAKPRVRVASRSGIGSFVGLAAASAELVPREIETNFTLGLTALLQSLKRRSLVVVLTDFADTVSSELLLENLRRVGRRHVVVFVALTDPAIEAIAAAAPTSRRVLHRAVVAGTIQRERAIVIERLRRLGIHPVEASAERLAADLISRYLDLKRREIA